MVDFRRLVRGIVDDYAFPVDLGLDCQAQHLFDAHTGALVRSQQRLAVEVAGVYRNGKRSLDLEWADSKLTLLESKKGGPVEPLGGSRFRAEDGDRFETITGHDGKTAYLFRSGRAYKRDTTK